MTAFWVFFGGGLGSLARFGVGKLTLNTMTNFPLGTFISNIVACAILAIIVYLLPLKAENTWLQPFLVIGFCGGFSTFSTFSHDNLKLLEQGSFGVAIANILVSVFVGIVIIFLVKSKLAH